MESRDTLRERVTEAMDEFWPVDRDGIVDTEALADVAVEQVLAVVAGEIKALIDPEDADQGEILNEALAVVERLRG